MGQTIVEVVFVLVCLIVLVLLWSNPSNEAQCEKVCEHHKYKYLDVQKDSDSCLCIEKVIVLPMEVQCE